MAAHDPDSGTGPRPIAPQVAGHFELLQEIGSGSSGTVYHARLTVPYADLPTGADVAVKFLRPELAADENAGTAAKIRGRRRKGQVPGSHCKS